MIGNKSIFYRNWFNSGIVYIKHLFNDNGTFVSFQLFQTRLQIREINFLKFHGCIEAVRKYMISCNITPTVSDSNENSIIYQFLKRSPNGAKCFYNVLLSCDFSHNCCIKWNQKLSNDVPWKDVFLFVKCIQEVKLKWFQIRILHRIIGTNVTLKAMRIRQDDLCTFCKTSRESIIHLFFECNVSKRFWNALKDFFISMMVVDNNFEFDIIMIIFGFLNGTSHSDMIHYITLVAKYFLYKCRCEDVLPTLLNFRHYLTKYYETEKTIAIKNQTLDRFEMKWNTWNRLVHILGDAFLEYIK